MRSAGYEVVHVLYMEVWSPDNGGLGMDMMVKDAPDDGRAKLDMIAKRGEQTTNGPQFGKPQIA